MKDPILKSMVEIINEIGVNIDFTLSVHGTMISGTAISNKEYLATVGEAFKTDAVNGTVNNAVGELFVELSETQQAKSGSDVDSNFINIKNAKIVNLEGDLHTTTVWRGKTESVDGFIFGSVARS